MRFEEQLATMRKGERNASLVSLMLRGLGEKMDAQTIVDRIRAAHPDMGEHELRHAMQTAQSLKTDAPSGGRIHISRAPTLEQMATVEEREFIQSHVASCPKATSLDLMERSPIDVSQATPNEQAMAFVATVFPDDRHFVFTANEDTKFMKRTRDRLLYPSQLFHMMADGAPVPNYVIANQFTGLPDDFDAAVSGDDFDNFVLTGAGSFACTATLATRRLALLEFDEMPLDEQARFWCAAIDRGAFGDRLRTLVFSGTKSIHALVRVDEAEHGDGDDPVAKWKAERIALSRLTECATDPRYRADRACKDPTRLTRMAGAIRICADGRRRVQRLLWCAQPSADDIPAIDCQPTFLTEGFGAKGEYYEHD